MRRIWHEYPDWANVVGGIALAALIIVAAVRMVQGEGDPPHGDIVAPVASPTLAPEVACEIDRAIAAAAATEAADPASPLRAEMARVATAVAEDPCP